MQTFYYARASYLKEVLQVPSLADKENIIYAAALLHDMCDHKYVHDEEVAIDALRACMQPYLSDRELDIVCKIIVTMSYSKVKKNGFPDLGEYQLAYHIVREADLMGAYDIDRCIIYSMMMQRMSYTEAVKTCIDLFNNRVLRYKEDDLLLLEGNREIATALHMQALQQVQMLKELVPS
jgi:HD superfamily phosphodiesterase